MYSTQHETAGAVRAVINLEGQRYHLHKEDSADCAAAGTTGGALLFQATSAEMIEVYSKVPQWVRVEMHDLPLTASPRGSVVAADVFATGVLVSERVCALKAVLADLVAPISANSSDTLEFRAWM